MCASLWRVKEFQGLQLAFPMLHDLLNNRVGVRLDSGLGLNSNSAGQQLILFCRSLPVGWLADTLTEENDSSAEMVQRVLGLASLHGVTITTLSSLGF